MALVNSYNQILQLPSAGAGSNPSFLPVTIAAIKRTGFQSILENEMLPARYKRAWQYKLSLGMHPKIECQKTFSSPVPNYRDLRGTLQLFTVQQAAYSYKLKLNISGQKPQSAEEC